jgi:hypothetical protein
MSPVTANSLSHCREYTNIGTVSFYAYTLFDQKYPDTHSKL